MSYMASSARPPLRNHGPPAAPIFVLDRPAWRPLKKAIAAGLAIGLLGTASLARAASAKTQFSRYAGKSLDLRLKIPTTSELFNDYMRLGTEFSREEGEAGEIRALEYFEKAIALDMRRALLLDADRLDASARPKFIRALRSAQFGAMGFSEDGRKKKSSKWLLWAGGIAAAAGLGYLIYELTKKKDDGNVTPPSQDYKVDLSFRVINATKGVLVEQHVIPQVMTSSEVTISINDLKSKYGLTGIDEQRIIIRGPTDNCELMLTQ